MSISKVAVLATGLAMAMMAATIHPLPAQAFPSKQQDCTNCHGPGTVSGTVNAVPSTTTPAAGAAYTVLITVPTTGGGDTGYWIANSTAAGVTGTTTGVTGGQTGSMAATYTAAMTAPATAGTYYYKVWAVNGHSDATGVTNFKVYSITVAGAPVVVTTTTALAVTPASPAVAPASPTLTATVTGTGAAGTVEFFNGTTSLGASPVAAGVATKALTGIAAGTYSYTAKFIPTNAAAFSPSTSSAVAYVVNVAPPVIVTTTTALAVTPASPVVAPAGPTLTATVTGTGAAGTVEFFNGTTSLGASPVAGGLAAKSLTGIAAGTYAYTAKFIPTNAAAFTSSTSSVVAYLVTAPPVAVPTASFTASAISGIAPLAVTLTDTSTGAPTSWLWTFGNGSSSNVQNPPVVSYTAAGTYTVTLIASNAGGASAAVSKTITVTAPVAVPTASFTASAISGIAPLAVTLTDTSTGAPTSWLWTFGNGSTSNVQNPPVVSYTAAGTYTVTLIASNAGGASAAVSKTITVTAPPVVVPVSSFTSSVASGIAPLTVAMTDTSTGTPTSWLWDLGDGTTSTLQNPSVTYTAAGTYTVTLTASNAGGAGNTASKVITVTAPPLAVPVASFTASATSGIVPLTVNLSGSATNSPTSWAWTFGNGTTSTVQNPSVTYTVVGTYTVTLIASNASGASAPVSKTITVTDPTTSNAKILWMSRDHGAVGDYVLIKGSGFGTSGAVNFGTVKATVSYWTAQWIVVKVPAGNVDGTSVGVTVTPSGGAASNAVSFRLVSDDGDEDDASSQSPYSVRLGGDLD